MSTNDILNDSPFKLLLGGNSALPDSEVPRLCELLAQPIAELETLNQQVIDLERALEDRMAQRLHLHLSLKKHESILHPIRRLPNDVLQRIFVFCLPLHPRVPSLSQTVAPLLLTRICGGWRKVALDMTRLWKGVHIVVQAGSRPFVEFHMAMVNRWLALAKDEPLNISIWSKETRVYSCLDVFKKAVLSHSPRIRTLRLDSLPLNVLELFGSLSSDAWPILEKVAITWPRGLHTKPQFPFLPAPEPAPGLDVPSLSIWRAPRLKAVKWVSVDHDIRQAGIQWDKLEELEVHPEVHSHQLKWTRFNAVAARAMVQSIPNIRQLRIELKEDRAIEELDCGPTGPLELQKILVLPQLTVLNLTEYCHPDTPQVVFLEGLQLPSLQVLQYDWRSPPGAERKGSPPPLGEPHPLVKFLHTQELPVAIKVFETDINALSWSDLVESLKVMPMVESLWLKDRDYSVANYNGPRKGDVSTLDKRLFDLLLPLTGVESHSMKGEGVGLANTGPDYMCPRLSYLRISHCKCELEDIEAFINARLSLSETLSDTSPARVAPLKRVQISGACKSPPETDMTVIWTSRGSAVDPVPGKARELEKALGLRGVRAQLYFNGTPAWLWGVAAPKRFDPWQGYSDERDEKDWPPEHNWV